jgi:hypothetical protein
MDGSGEVVKVVHRRSDSATSLACEFFAEQAQWKAQVPNTGSFQRRHVSF